MTTLPSFLVAGAARSGTTGVVEGLRTHPQVFLTQPKEPHYFAFHGQRVGFHGPGDAATINRVAVTNREDYLNLYPTDHGYLALGDGSVSTLYYAAQAAPEISRMNPEMRIVLILREPVARAYSSYLYMRSRGFEPRGDFLDAVAEESERRRRDWHHLWHYTGMSLYAEGIGILREAVGADRVGVWFYDDLERDYSATVSSVLRFLELPRHAEEAQGVPRINVSGTPRFALLQRGLWWATRNETLRQAVKNGTSFRFRERVRRAALNRSVVPREAHRSLQGQFTQDLQAVATMLDGPLPEWLSTHRKATHGDSPTTVCPMTMPERD